MMVNAASSLPVRPATAAGRFYPADAATLRAQVSAFLEQAVRPLPGGTVRAVIVPHAGYIYSGPIAGYGYRALQQGAADARTVFLLGPAHFVPLSGLAVGPFAALRTPLGDAPVALDALGDLRQAGKGIVMDATPHLPEHSLEVQVPFLQVVMGDRLRLAPLLCGRCDPRMVAAFLMSRVARDSEAVLVISSDLSHYHPYERARQLDQALLDAIVEGDIEAAAAGEACGLTPILAVMEIARQSGWRPHLLDYRNSGDTAGDRARVVGYAALAYLA